VNKKPKNVQVALLLELAGEDSLAIFKSFEYGEITDADGKKVQESADDYETVLDKFKQYCKPMKNTVYERYRFWSRNQEDKEPVDQWLLDLRALIKDCEFGDQESRMIRDKLVFGIQDEKVKEKMLREGNLKLQRAIDIIHAAELSKKHLATMSGPSSEVHAISKGYRKNPNKNESPHVSGHESNIKAQSYSREKSQCNRCGYKHEARRCPAYGKTCNKCQRPNHFAKVCRSARNVNYVDEDDDFQIDVIYNVDALDEDWIQPLTINGAIIPCKLDTGAQTNVMSEQELKSLPNQPKVHKVTTKLTGYYNADIPVLGRCITTVQHKGQSYNMQFIIVPGTAPTLLGRSACERLNLIKRIYTVKADMLNDYPDLFQGLGCLPGEVHIKLKTDAEPVIEPCRKVPFKMQEQLKEELQRMQKAGIIKPVVEPSEWVNAMHVVYKPNGQLRVCLDPRNLNKSIRREHFKLPTREEIMSKFAGSTVFSKLDATKGFWQLKLSEEASKLCTFITPVSRFRYRRLPF
jgi:hypothetical protein